RMLIKRAYRHAGIPDAQVSEDQIEAARRADIMCHHPRMANIMGLPFCGVIYSEPLRTRTPLASGLLHDSCRSFSNNVQHKLGLRQHRDMTAVGLEDRCPHALCDEALQLGLDGLVLGGYDVPAWLGSPGGSFNLLIEEIRCRRSMCCPDKFLLMLRQITGKGRNAVWFQPNTPVCHFNMREDVCGRKLFLQTSCRFVSIWRKRSDVNESGDTSVRPGGSDDGSSIGVTD